jgi:MFS superfamily sulfate permease-like transporter
VEKEGQLLGVGELVIVVFAAMLTLAVPVAVVLAAVFFYRKLDRKMDRIEGKVDAIERELKQRE